MPPLPEPLLLDTCVLQHLAWVERVLEEAGGHMEWNEEATSQLETRYGPDTAADLMDLGALWIDSQDNGNALPWLVSPSAAAELARSGRQSAREAEDLRRYFEGHQEDWSSWSYPGVALGLLFESATGGPARPSPLILRALGVADCDGIVASPGPLDFMRDRGDRLVVRDALLANVPGILTLDRRSFWAHRCRLEDLGVTVLRPSELLDRQHAP
jgi:hypothetical protein